jgi:hypothetical protein
MIGMINGSNSNNCNVTIINPKVLLFIQEPSTFGLWTYDRDIVISETYFGSIKDNFIFGSFNAGHTIIDN